MLWHTKSAYFEQNFEYCPNNKKRQNSFESLQRLGYITLSKIRVFKKKDTLRLLDECLAHLADYHQRHWNQFEHSTKTFLTNL